MEQQEREMPIKCMLEIVRLFLKLKNNDLTECDVVIEETSNIVNKKLQTTYTLKAGDTTVASYVLVDKRSLKAIKQQVEAQKANIVEEKAQLLEKADELLFIVDNKADVEKE